jgi:hypothetical protein
VALTTRATPKTVGAPFSAPGRLADWIATAGATAVWTALVVAQQADPRGLTLGGNAQNALIYGIPALLALALIFDARLSSRRPLQLALAWAGLVVAANVAVDALSANNVKPLLALPALVISAAVFGRRPVLGVTLAFVMSGFYGSLIAFWQFPEEKTVQLVMGGLALALIWQAFVIGREHSIRMTLGLAFPLIYGYISIVQLMLDTGNPAAGRGFMTSVWFMTPVAVIALAGWPRHVLERIAKGILVVTALVGAYAVYRWLTDISLTEYKSYGGDQYNYVGGKLRLLGSFPTGQDLGGWTAAVVPFALAMAFAFKGRWRSLALAAAILSLIGMAGSQVRIAVVAVALGTLVVVLLHETSGGFAGLRLGSTATALVAMVAIGVAAFQITGGTTDKVSHSYTSLLRPFDRSDPSVSARIYKWDQAVRDLRGHPFGYGLGTANKQSTGFLQSFESIGQYDVDNGYLVVALEQGLAVMVIFVLALLLLMTDLIRKSVALTDAVPAAVAIGAAGTLVSFLVIEWAVAFQDGPRALAIWIIVGLGLAQFTTARVDTD